MKKGILILLMYLSGCTTIYFENGSETYWKENTEKWHHNLVFALVEVSDPVNLRYACANMEWSQVKTELTFLNGLASGVTNLFVPIWYPKTVSVSCQ